MRFAGIVIGTLVAALLNLTGIFFGGLPFMAVIAVILEANWGVEVFWQNALAFIPVCGAILYTILLSLSDKYLIKSLKYREPSKDEYKRLKESGALDVLEKSKAKIKNVLISDENDVNACAVGSETVVFTVGILSHEEVSEDMIRGVAAHEAGHIFNGDSKTLRMFYAFSRIGQITELFAVGLINFAAIFTRIKIPLINLLALSMYLGFYTIHLLFILLLKSSRFINLCVSRNMEFAADEYAYKEGHGEGLKKTLILFDRWHKAQEVENMKNGTLLEKMIPNFLKVSRNLLSTHPVPERRIKALEKLEAKKNIT